LAENPGNNLLNFLMIQNFEQVVNENCTHQKDFR